MAARRSWTALGSLALVAALAPALPQQPARKADDPVETMIRGLLEPPRVTDLPAPRDPKILAAERLKLALRLREDKLRTLVHMIGDPNENRAAPAFVSATVERLLLWSRRALDARLDGAETRVDRTEVLARELAWSRKMGDTLKALAKGAASGLSQAEIDQVAFYGLEVEGRLASETAATK
jgi:hypothetical protein